MVLFPCYRHFVGWYSSVILEIFGQIFWKIDNFHLFLCLCFQMGIYYPIPFIWWVIHKIWIIWTYVTAVWNFAFFGQNFLKNWQKKCWRQREFTRFPIFFNFLKLYIYIYIYIYSWLVYQKSSLHHGFYRS